MTFVDKVESVTRAAVQSIVDKEPVNYLEAGSLYGIVAQGRYNIAFADIMYNHAMDPELKKLIKDAIEDIVKPLVNECEKLLQEGGAEIPKFHYNERNLHKEIEIHSDARLSDYEIVAAIGTMAKASQMALLGGLHQSYQLEIGVMLRRYLDKGLDWNYRLLQLMIHRGWLPTLAKIQH